MRRPYHVIYAGKEISKDVAAQRDVWYWYIEEDGRAVVETHYEKPKRLAKKPSWITT